VAFEHVLGRVHMEHDAEHARAEAIRRTTWPGHTILQLAVGAPLASTRFWRSVELSFPYRR
jgi:hypothetical protein